MNAMVIGVYGLYLILVGLKGNAGQLATDVQADAPKFLPWIIAIFVLAALHGSSETGRKITTPFLGLLILTYVLKNFKTLQQQTEALWNMAAGASTTNASVIPGSSSASGATISAPTSAPAPAAIPGAPAPASSTSNLSNPSDALYAMENLLG